MQNFKLKRCKVSGFEWKQYNSLQKCPCDECVEVRKQKAKPPKTHEQKKQYKIAKQSKKRKVLNEVYIGLKKAFFAKPENKVCFIKGCNRPAVAPEHLKGRIGYADQWARNNDVPLLIDIRFWKPCCWEHNPELESNSELSHEYQLSKLHNGRKGDLK